MITFTRQKVLVEGKSCFGNLKIIDKVIQRGKQDLLCAAVLGTSNILGLHLYEED